jgi:hypothetical protein
MATDGVESRSVGCIAEALELSVKVNFEGNDQTRIWVESTNVNCTLGQGTSARGDDWGRGEWAVTT